MDVQSPLPVTFQCCPEGRPERVRGRQYTSLSAAFCSVHGWVDADAAVVCVAASSRQVLACGHSTGAVRF